MNINQLDEMLRNETLTEKNNKNNIANTLFPNIHLPDGNKLDINSRKEFAELVDNSEGAVVSRQDRYKAVPTHSHEWIELAYMYSGSTSITFSDTKVNLNQGDCLLINSGIPHSNASCGNDDILINFLISKNHLNNNFFNRFSDASFISNYFVKALQDDHSANDYILFHSGNSRRLPVFIQEYIIEFYNKGIYSKDFLDSFITLIFLELADIYKNQVTDTIKDNDIVYILRYIEENYNNCTLQSTADFFHMNPNYLSGYIKKNTGKNFKKLIQEHRLNHAARLLKNTNLSVTDIAHEAGYDNVTFFYKKFKESYNSSPTEFRNIR